MKILAKVIAKVKRKVDTRNGNRSCWYCGGALSWQSDFNYDEVHGEGEGIATFLTCTNCGAEVEYSLKETENEDE